MLEILDTIRPVISGLMGGAAVGMLVFLAKPNSTDEGGRKTLGFGTGFRVVAVLLVPLAVFIAYAALNARADQLYIAIPLSAALLAGSVFLLYQAFFVTFSYDRQHVYYASPLAGERKAPWSALVDVGHSHLMQADYIVVDGIGRIWCSSMLDGYEELAEFLEDLIEGPEEHR